MLFTSMGIKVLKFIISPVNSRLFVYEMVLCQKYSILIIKHKN